MKSFKIKHLKPILSLILSLSFFLIFSCSSTKTEEIADGLYSLKDAAQDYSFAMSVFKGDYIKGRDDKVATKPILDVGYTSSVSTDLYFARNYNTLMDDKVYFIINSPKTSSSYASLAVAKGFEGMDKAFMKDVSNYDTYLK